jgi:hypothetical protein
MKKRSWTPHIVGGGVLLVATVVGVLMFRASGTVEAIGASNMQGFLLKTKLPHQMFSSANPGVILYLPPGFVADQPLDVVIYFRGFGSCINVISSDQDGPCYAGGHVHRASKILSQFQAARKNALLVIPEFRMESSDTELGTFATQAGLDAFLQECMHAVSDGIGKALQPIASISVYSHSGGWHANAQVIKTQHTVRDVVLFDSFYGDQSTFQAYALDAAQVGWPSKRFVSLYTGGRPETNSEAVARAVRAQFPNALLVQASAGVPTTADMQHPVYMKASTLSHPDVPGFYFGKFVGSSFLSTLAG